MALQIYNTLTKQKEEFKPVDPEKVKIYSCGPTVYDYFHIGNARAFVVPDILKRYLEYKGYNVFHVMNFTDIDDKMIKRANKEGVSIKELADRFIDAYFEDTKKLNIKEADVYPRATDYIEDIIKLLKRLEEEGYAYEVDGDIFFEVKKFADYGKLSNQNLEELASGARIEVNEQKKDPLDFVLWKRSKEGEPAWDSPWGPGRPGWHTECSVMSRHYLGDKFDFHTGGIDLAFPHHENEIAQSEAVNGEQVINYWVHNGYVNVDGEKMSKSLGNFFTTRDILKDYSPDVVRFFLISNHYRSPINFSDVELNDAKKSLRRLRNTVARIHKLIPDNKVEIDAGNQKEVEAIERAIDDKRVKFEEAMDDDLNTALAIASLHELAKKINIFVNDSEFEINKATVMVLEKAYNTFEELGSILGIELRPELKEEGNKLIPPLIELLLEIREEAREEQNWDLADKIRDELKELGITIKDRPQGTEWEIE
ncbi:MULTISPECIES: cysteine--tRNA ligase [unclassified Candidatus Frackibacter]|uniref:cysteine--tRNA ligase n=1 Tax=unclassified Candidatus Frackibacter TaxID=2648818 RepID=UPI00089022B9|nr:MULTISPECIES: cysteine--tRNA ligase [unclassified Candidatus Frackibacter]SDC21424.1 cysteinyl-tRNA synthetase [Candidatus Frackibacter sp. WG11]SEM50391.1 cysteinyl-tRNA synthetase [Candidatus Frackibacter sp. WG12]SFL51809.1 cysteinyl-tRNA synthetase [Candidatus Frackibacter sp. WG13]